MTIAHNKLINRKLICTTPWKQSGVSLVELMVSMLAGMVVIGGVTSVFVSTVSSSASTLGASKLNQEMTTAMNIMVNDIRRSGFDGGMVEEDYANPQNNPYSASDSILTIIDSATSNTTEVAIEDMVDGTSNGGQCIVYSYDQDLSGDTTVPDDERFGFKRIEDNNGFGKIQIRTSAPSGEFKNCAGNNSNWSDLTDDRVINITELKFTMAASACLNSTEPDEEDDDGDGTNDNPDEFDCYTVTPDTDDIQVITREVTITLKGELRESPEVHAEMTQNVRVRNDAVTITP